MYFIIFFNFIDAYTQARPSQVSEAWTWRGFVKFMSNGSVYTLI